jgi:hypothetical protein
MYCNNKYKKNPYKKWHPILCYKQNPTCPKCPDVDPKVDPPGLYIFDPNGGYYTSFDDAVKKINLTTYPTQEYLMKQVYDKQINNQYGDRLCDSNRYAFCFLPGTYNYTIPVDVGYYTTLSGLGLNPDEVIINALPAPDPKTPTVNPVRCISKYDNTFLDTFWRSCENMKLLGNKTEWFVSQAAPLNNMIIDGNLHLAGTDADADGNTYASGGFIGNSTINGNGYTPDTNPSSVKVYSQQQWCNLNSSFKKFSNTVWNLTNIGCNGDLDVVQTPKYGPSSITEIDTTPKIAGKPYLYYDGSFNMVKPGVKPDISGPLPLTQSDYTLIDNIFYANPNTPDDIQKNIDAGKSIVLTPGIYNLTKTITISTNNIIILGLGMATLVAPTGGPAISVTDSITDLRLSSFIIQANTNYITNDNNPPVLLQIGENSNKNSDSNIFLDNIFIKVGPELTTDDNINVNTMLTINTNGVVASNLWLWRADHGPNGQIKGASKCNNGLIVNGDNVYIYGLFVEHASENLITWTGNAGKLYFLQSEYPYDVNIDFKNPCLTVTGDNFVGQALGVYCYFRDYPVIVPNAIKCFGDNVKITNALTVWLNGNKDSSITHVVNDTGDQVDYHRQQNDVGPSYVNFNK